MKQNHFVFVWDEEDFYNFDQSLANIILKIFTKLIERNGLGYPTSFNTYSEYKEQVLDKVVKSFELLSRNTTDFDENRTKIIQEGLDLFAKYYMAFWE